MADIGFLGLGAMGSAMARRLLEQGHDVTVWNRSDGPVDELVAAGARRATTAAEALAMPLSASMLANDEAADAVLTAEALASGAGGLHVNMASISPASADRLVERAAVAGIGYLACPVLGRPPVAASGGLNLLVAGRAEDIERAEPLTAALGVKVWHIGDEPRAANVAKIAVNYQIIHALQAIGESIAVVERHGIDTSGFVDLLTSTLFGGVVYSGYGAMIAERRYTPPGFTVQLGLKDLGLAEAVASEVGVALAAAPVLHDAFERTLEATRSQHLDWAAIAEVSRTSRTD